MQIDPGEILDFWFGGETDDLAVSRSRSPVWWGKEEATDSEIRRRFLAAVRAAAAGKLDGWGAAPRELLARIILIDQFNRNIWRNDPRAFEDDPLARDWTRQLLESDGDLALRPIERVFAYLPLEHSENIADQDQCILLFERLRDNHQGELRKLFEGYLDYARAHQRIIARFGRFPHRNAILGRNSTASEIEFLSRPGSSF